MEIITTKGYEIEYVTGESFDNIGFYSLFWLGQKSPLFQKDVHWLDVLIPVNHYGWKSASLSESGLWVIETRHYNVRYLENLAEKVAQQIWLMHINQMKYDNRHDCRTNLQKGDDREG